MEHSLLQDLWRLGRYQGLLWTMAQAEIKARHRQTVLGMLWAAIQPVSIMLVFVVVFSVFVRIPVEGVPYVLFVFIGLWLWLFFANAMSTAFPSVTRSMNLVTKANFPREVIPLAKLAPVVVDFLVGAALLALLLLIHGVKPSPSWLAVPGLVAILLGWTIGLVLLGSAISVVQRDLGSLLPLLLQVWMFLSPVIYPISVIPEAFRSWYLLNPMALILEAFRTAVLDGLWPPLVMVGPVAVVAIVSLVAGYLVFKRLECQFADVM